MYIFQDENRNILEKTIFSHPYSYPPFVTWRGGDVSDANHVLYSDRLLQWDYDKTRKLMKEVFSEDGDSYNNRTPEKIELFLQRYTEDENLKLILMMQGCNVSNGYPYWIFYISTSK